MARTDLATRQTRILARVRELGFDSVTAYADARPRASFVELALTLWGDFAGIDVKALLHYEAEEAGDLGRYARATLARYFCERLPDGWGRGTRADFNAASAFGAWSSTFTEDLRPEITRVIAAFTAVPPNDGWRPSGPDDAVLLRAFAGTNFDPAPNTGS